MITFLQDSCLGGRKKKGNKRCKNCASCFSRVEVTSSRENIMNGCEYFFVNNNKINGYDVNVYGNFLLGFCCLMWFLVTDLR